MSFSTAQNLLMNIIAGQNSFGDISANMNLGANILLMNGVGMLHGSLNNSEISICTSAYSSASGSNINNYVIIPIVLNGVTQKIMIQWGALGNPSDSATPTINFNSSPSPQYSITPFIVSQKYVLVNPTSIPLPTYPSLNAITVANITTSNFQIDTNPFSNQYKAPASWIAIGPTTWIASSNNSNLPVGGWHSVCSSYSGQYLAACINEGGLYTSKDYGASWLQSQSFLSTSYWSLACDSTGKYIYCGQNSGGSVFYSSDYGVTFTQVTSGLANGQYKVACSSDGSIVYAVNYANSGLLYKSSNFGQTWTSFSSSFAPNGQLNVVACDNTGTCVLISLYSGGVYLTTNINTTAFTLLGSTPNVTDASVTYNQTTGKYIIAFCALGGKITYSSNSGSSPQFLGGINNWQSVRIAQSNPNYLVACTSNPSSNTNGNIFISTNAGSSFTSQVSVGNGGSGIWTAVAPNYNGNSIIACDNSGYVWTYP